MADSVLSMFLRCVLSLLGRPAPSPARLTLGFWSLAMNLNVGDVVVGRLSVLDAHGFASTLPDVPAWVSSDSSVLTVAADPSGLSAVVTAVKPGTATVSVHDAAANLDAAAEITVVVSPPVKLDIVFGPVPNS